MNWKWEAFSKNNANYDSVSVPIFLSGGCGWERIFYIITVITAVGVALGDGRHYNATLCKEALGKKITGMSCEAYVFLFCALGKLFA